MPSAKSPRCAASRTGGWPPGTSNRACGFPAKANGQAADAGGSDPLAAIRSINALASRRQFGHLVLANFHRFLSSPGDRPGPGPADHQRQSEPHVRGGLVAVVQIPIELEKLFVVVEHDLPSREQIEEIARGIATEEGELPEGAELETVLDAASGLTRYEAEAAFSLSLVRHKQVRADAVWELKCQTLKKSGLLHAAPGRRDVRRPGRPGVAQELLLPSMRRQGPQDPLKRAQGNFAALAARLRKKPVCQKPWQRGGPSHADAWTSAR